jgi:hypothetical protein
MALVGAIGIFQLAAVAETADPSQVKWGVIKTDERWSGDIYLVGDLTIPEGLGVTVAADTRIHFASYDLLQTGEDPQRCEIIVHGRWYADSQPEQPIRLQALDGGWARLPRDAGTQVLSFQPYVVETQNLREEFRGFKNEYLILWSVIYALWIMR